MHVGTYSFEIDYRAEHWGQMDFFTVECSDEGEQTLRDLGLNRLVSRDEMEAHGGAIRASDLP